MRVLVLAHTNLLPPIKATRAQSRVAPWRTEYDVSTALRSLGHEVEVLGVDSSIEPLAETLRNFSPEVVFNLLEEFDGDANLEFAIPAYLRLKGVSFTGCDARALLLAKDKTLAKKIVAVEGILTPAWAVADSLNSLMSNSDKMRYPLILKLAQEEASLGLTFQSVANGKGQLKLAFELLRKISDGKILVEEYIEGREFYVSVLGHQRLEVFPPRELIFGRLPSRYPRIATAQLKWNLKFRRKYGITTKKVAESERDLIVALQQIARRVYVSLGINGYARVDFRMDTSGNIYFLEVNPNPQICQGEDFADSAKAAGLKYKDLIQTLLDQVAQKVN